MASISTSPISTGISRDEPRIYPARPARYALASVGIASVAMGAVGVVVPGLPTTVFLIVAAWCFARSCPWLTERLIHTPLFGPFLKYIVPGAVMPRRAKAISIAVMWAAIALSCVLIVSGDAPAWVPATVVLSGLVGTWFIVRQGRGVRRQIDESARAHQHPVGRSMPAHKNAPCTTTTGGRSKTH